MPRRLPLLRNAELFVSSVTGGVSGFNGVSASARSWNANVASAEFPPPPWMLVFADVFSGFHKHTVLISSAAPAGPTLNKAKRSRCRT